MPRTLNAHLWLLVTGAALSLLMTTSAQAHISLIKSIPEADAVTAPLTQIALTFNERLVPRASRLEVSILDNGGVAETIEHMDVDIIDDGKTLRASLHHPLESGAYLVQWRAVGDDSHPVTGQFSFTIE